MSPDRHGWYPSLIAQIAGGTLIATAATFGIIEFAQALSLSDKAVVLSHASDDLTQAQDALSPYGSKDMPKALKELGQARSRLLSSGQTQDVDRTDNLASLLAGANPDTTRVFTSAGDLAQSVVQSSNRINSQGNWHGTKAVLVGTGGVTGAGVIGVFDYAAWRAKEKFLSRRKIRRPRKPSNEPRQYR